MARIVSATSSGTPIRCPRTRDSSSLPSDRSRTVCHALFVTWSSQEHLRLLLPHEVGQRAGLKALDARALAKEVRDLAGKVAVRLSPLDRTAMHACREVRPDTL